MKKNVDQLMMMEEKQCRVEGESNEILDLSIIQSLHKRDHTIINKRCFFTEESFKKVIDGGRVVGRDSIPFQYQWMRVIDCHFFTTRLDVPCISHQDSLPYHCLCSLCPLSLTIDSHYQSKDTFHGNRYIHCWWRLFNLPTQRSFNAYNP